MSNKKSFIYQKQRDRFVEKLAGRDYILGLDLGVGSIGAAVVALDKDGNDKLIPSKVVYSEARIFKSSAGAADRRDFRSQRNSLRHKKNRLKNLWKILSEKSLMLPFVEKSDVPDASVLMFSLNVRKESPYDLRYRALSEKISLEELGYAIYHLANHRGSSSVFCEDEVKGKKSENEKYFAAKEKTKDLKKSLNVETFIDVLKEFNNSNPENKCCRNTDRISGVIAPMPTRDLIKEEFEKIIETQRGFYSVLDENYVEGIRKTVFYENKMIVPEQENCPYFPSEKKLPKMAFINEERRLWEAVNNIRYSELYEDIKGRTSKIKDVRLTDSERQKCFDYLNSGKKITDKTLKDLLENQHIEDIRLQGRLKDKQEIQGFRFCKIRDNDNFKKLSNEDQIEVMLCFQNSVSMEDFYSRAGDRIGISKDCLISIGDDLLKLRSVKGYAVCGFSAMKILLKSIKDEGLSFNQAVCKAIEEGKFTEIPVLRECKKLPYYGKVIPSSMQRIMGKAWNSNCDSSKSSFNKPETSKEEEQFGRIANPVVHQTLNELRKLVNELIEIFGKSPKVVKIETARELKIGKEKRDELSKDNSKKEKRNKEIYEQYCLPHGLDYSKVKTFRIWEKQGKVCPYCVQPIKVEDIVSGIADKDHIFPREDVPGNPESNLVVAHRGCNNKRKGKNTPYEAFSDDVELWNKILQNADLNLKDKKWRFEMTGDEYKEWLKTSGMLSRFKTDNSYISTVAREYLSCLFFEDEVRHCAVDTVKGSETALLRNAWRLQEITDELALLHDFDSSDNKSRAGEQTDSVNSSKKNRTDARHHALDAIVIAYSSRSLTKKINTLNAYDVDSCTIESMIDVPLYFKNEKYGENSDIQRKYFSDYIRNVVLNETFISRKIDHSKTGALLKGTSYSIYALKGDNLIYGSMKKVRDIKIDSKNDDKIKKELSIDFSIPDWVNEDERLKIERIISDNKRIFDNIVSKKTDAETSLKKENEGLASEGKKERTINDKAIMERALKLVGGKYRTIANGTRSKIV